MQKGTHTSILISKKLLNELVRIKYASGYKTYEQVIWALIEDCPPSEDIIEGVSFVE